MSPRQVKNLTALNVSREKKLGMYADGGGLYLQVSKNGAKSWIYRFKFSGSKGRYMGLGSLVTISLADARELATTARKQVLEGIDPIKARRDQRAHERFEASKGITFKSAAEQYIESHKAGWNNKKHIAQWSSTLETYAYPAFGALSVQDIDVGLVMKALEPIWTEKSETASRVRGRVESVLDWATVRGYRKGENPARWKGHLESLLPARRKVQTVRHHPAMPYENINAFIEKLREQAGISAKALEFLILTASRTSEVIGARPEEFDLKTGVWNVAAERMKMKKEHRIPLSDRAITIIEEVIGAGDFVFPGGKKGKPLSHVAMLILMKRMGYADFTVHGFRSSIRDWAAEQTNYAREVAEAMLAHRIEDRVEAAYRRGDLFEKRRRLMDEWAKYCGTVRTAGKVVPIRRRK